MDIGIGAGMDTGAAIGMDIGIGAAIGMDIGIGAAMDGATKLPAPPNLLPR